MVGIFIGAIVAALIIQTAALAATLTRAGGPVNAISTVTANDLAQSAFTDARTVPGMSVNVTVPAGERALLIITFSAETLCWGIAGSYCYLRARVNGQTASPGEVAFASTDDGGTQYSREANSMQFVAGPVGAGMHTVDIRWRVPHPNQILFEMTGRTLTVMRSKV